MDPGPISTFETVFGTMAEKALIAAAEEEIFDNQALSVETMSSSVKPVFSDEEYALAPQTHLNSPLRDNLSTDIVSSRIHQATPTVLAEVNERQGDRSILSGDLIEADLIEANLAEAEAEPAVISEPTTNELVVARSATDMAAVHDANASISVETLGIGTIDGLMIARGSAAVNDGVALVNLNQAEENIDASVSLLTSVNDNEIDFDNLAVTGQIGGDASFPVMLI